MANNEPMTAERIAAIKARADAATPPPWKTGKDDFTKNIINADKDRGTIIVQRRDDFNMCGYSCIPIEQTFADAAFIAHARQDIPDLLAEVERLRAEVAQLRARETWLAEQVAIFGNPFCVMPYEHECEFCDIDSCGATIKARAECWRKLADMATRENPGISRKMRGRGKVK